MSKLGQRIENLYHAIPLRAIFLVIWIGLGVLLAESILADQTMAEIWQDQSAEIVVYGIMLLALFFYTFKIHAIRLLMGAGAGALTFAIATSIKIPNTQPI